MIEKMRGWMDRIGDMRLKDICFILTGALGFPMFINMIYQIQSLIINLILLIFGGFFGYYINGGSSNDKV